MKKVIFTLLFLIGFLYVQGKIWYVKPSVIIGGANDGSSWYNSANNLNWVLSNAQVGDQIWVAAGTYKSYGYIDNGLVSVTSDDSFILKRGVKIYGGFAGNEISLSQRNINTNLTVLSGLLSAQGTSFGGEIKAHHVVISAGDVGDACLDGFTIEGGKANGSGYITVNGQTVYRNQGGGIYVINSNPVLKNIKIINSYAVYGGGMYLSNSSDNLNLVNIKVHNNEAQYDGGGIYCFVKNAALTNIESSKNICGRNGGGMYINGQTTMSNGGNLTITNVTIVYNQSATGGGIYRTGYFNSKSIRNSIITFNTVSSNNYWGTYGFSGSECEYSLIKHLTNYSTNNCLNDNVDPLFMNTSSNDYSLSLNSPCIGKGKNGINSSATDLAGNPRWRGPNIDLGAYESSNTTKSLSDRINNNYENILDEESSKIELSVYPNPINSNERINISLGNYYNPVTVGVYSLEGKLIHSKAYEGGDFKLDIPDLAPGMYLIHVQTQEGENFTKKIIVNK